MADPQLSLGNMHRVTLGERQLLFHLPTSGLFELDDLSASILDLLKRQAGIGAEALVAYFDGRYPGGEVLDSLAELTSLDAVGTAAGKAVLPRDALTSLVLNVTTGCNLSCGYCYKEDLTSPAAARRLPADKARAAVDLLLRESGDRPRLNISFFGGEPLSNLPLIQETVDYAETRAAAAGRQMDFSLTTNATLLDDRTIAWLDAHRFGISVSMDGPAAVHDRNRRTAGGQGTYAVVAAKARRLLERYRSRPVGARVTVTAGATDVVAIHQHLKDELGFAEVGIAPVTAGLPDGAALDDRETALVFDGLLSLADRWRDAALEGRDIGFSNINQLIAALHDGHGKIVPCGAGYALLAVDTDGRLQLCQRFSGSTLSDYGDVERGPDHDRLDAFLSRAVARADGACRGCSARHLCAGGCYHEAYARHGDPFRPTDHYCTLIRRWIDKGIAVYAEVMAENPGFLARHGGRGG